MRDASSGKRCSFCGILTGSSVHLAVVGRLFPFNLTTINDAGSYERVTTLGTPSGEQSGRDEPATLTLRCSSSSSRGWLE